MGIAKTKPDTLPEVLNIEEARALLRVSRPTMVKLTESGVIPYMLAGNRYRFSRAALLNAVATGAEPRTACKSAPRVACKLTKWWRKAK
jgi:excisionase family DNA binding protein